MSVAVSGSHIRLVLKFFFVLVSMLLVVAAIFAIVAWRKSSTPLVRSAPVVESGVDVEAFHRGRYHFPGDRWRPVDPADFGWDSDKLEQAHAYARTLDTSSLIVLHRGVPIAVWGDVEHRENSQSIRKALLSSLYGRLVADEGLDLDTSLEALGIDDDPPLTAEEKTASVRHLLLSRSGIYHSALYEAGMWKRRKPKRSSAAPGEQWYYNNWGFNALATIYETVAGRPVGEAFEEQVAEPIGMADFRARDVMYVRKSDLSERSQGNQSNHPAYIFMISARDLARFGLLYLAEGRWGDRDVLPAGWVHESTVDAGQATGWDDRRYGFLWWIMPPREALPYESIMASGGRGHKVTIVPALDLVVVHRIPTGGSSFSSQIFRRFVWHPAVDDREHDSILEMVLNAYPDLPPAASKLMSEDVDPGLASSNSNAEAAADTQPAPTRSAS